ncbi:MAG: peptide chain release factor 1 [Armatimonadetes bacterium]|nr:peptide chain release factor 1 [Armatimonadota bacterium]
MWDKLREIEERYEKVQEDLQNPNITSDIGQLQKLGKLNAELEPYVANFRRLQKAKDELQDAEEMLSDPEMKDAALAEIGELRRTIETLEEELRVMLLPTDPNDRKSVIIEVTQGAGGEEAALFAAELFRMYTRFAERRAWKYDVIDMEETGIGGVSSVTFSIDADGAFSQLKHESGVHRVQRVPKTESSGRIHTSAANVLVLPEAEDVEVDIRPEDLEMDTYRAGGAGGQHVNKTESAVRIKHKPSGVIVTCQDQRSQLQNRDRAMRVLRAKLFEKQQDELNKAQSKARLSIGSGDRSEKIRTYNFPQSRVTDHRINFTSHNLNGVMDGDLQDIVDALVSYEQAKLLAAHASE